MLLGYARVSKKDDSQVHDLQLDVLKKRAWNQNISIGGEIKQKGEILHRGSQNNLNLLCFV